MRTIRQCLFLSLAASLAACQQMPLGPDLAAAPSPFGDSPSIYIETGTPDKDLAFARITHATSGDTATAHADIFARNRDFDARLTWYAFESGKAELDAPYDYWLTGINVLQSLDRSAHVILRLPDGWTPRPGTSSQADVMYVTCEMMGFYYPFTRPKAFEEEATVGGQAPEPRSNENSSEFMSTTLESETCDFTSLDQVHTAAPQMLLDADWAGPPDSASPLPNYLWRPVTIRIP